MALEIVKLGVLNSRLVEGYRKIDNPVNYVNGQVVLGHENASNIRSLVRWMNETIMVFPSSHTRGELFAAALSQIYGQDWSVLIADPMSMAMRSGTSLDDLRDEKLIRQFGFSHQDY